MFVVKEYFDCGFRFLFTVLFYAERVGRNPHYSRFMKKIILIIVCMAVGACLHAKSDLWPDGTAVDRWFSDTTRIDMNTLGRRYVITDYGVTADSTIVQTEAIQRVINSAAANGGGVVVVPKGTFLSGALFFKQNTHLYLSGGAVIKGSAHIIDFPVCETRIEGETCRYFPALINADSVDGFTIGGSGTINGNGLDYWQAFWIRRMWNPQCTNKDEQRPRLVYISNSTNVTVQDVRLINSPFWTNHLYRCDKVRYISCHIYAPTEGVYPPEPKRGAPSSDAIDIDACRNILIYGCFMHVNDDAVVMKGGKGTYADKDENNGENTNILIDRCRFGQVHACLTLGSESLHNRNIVLRNCISTKADRVIWLKMRPDTPQHYEYVTVENMSGRCGSFLMVRPWTQFFNPQKRDDMPLSLCNNITIKGITMNCNNFFNMGASDKYCLADFTFADIDVTDETGAFAPEIIRNAVVKNVKINNIKIKYSK